MRRCLFVALLLLLVCVTACSGNRDPGPFRDLHTPGVAKIAGMTGLQNHDDPYARIYYATTYASNLDGGATHVFFAVNRVFYDMRLDGSDLKVVKLPCDVAVAIAPGGRWVACRTDAGIVVHDLTGQQADLSITDPSSSLAVLAPNSITWAPDGHHFAAITDRDGGCSIAVYGINFLSGDRYMTAFLTLPELAPAGYQGKDCAASNLAWSPDGTQLAFIGFNEMVIDVPVAFLHLLTRSPDSLPITQVIKGEKLATVALCGEYSGLTWTASSKSLAFVDSNGWNIDQIDLDTYKTKTLIVQHVTSVFDLSWTPDGNHLLFVLAMESDELIAPASQIYVYTPSDVHDVQPTATRESPL